MHLRELEVGHERLGLAFDGLLKALDRNEGDALLVVVPSHGAELLVAVVTPLGRDPLRARARRFGRREALGLEQHRGPAIAELHRHPALLVA
eukprot:5980977-Prymnesium_polylepis.1